MKSDSKETPPLRAVKLQSSYDCRRLLAKVVNQCIRGEIEDSKARTVGYLLQVLTKVIADADTESRLAQLETSLEGLNSKKPGFIG